MTTILSRYEYALRKIYELQDHVQWAGEFWLRDCEALNLQFRITEAYRSQERQNQLYAQGRTKDGPIVTWTRNSMHTKKLAVDIVPLNCSYEDIEQVANRYGIYRLPSLVKLGDLGHFQFDKVSKKPPVIFDPKANARRLRRMIEVETNEAKRRRLQERLNAIIAQDPSLLYA